jgi:hypothetical protein
MDKQEAKKILQACRANGEDAARPVFAEALALVENDAELRAWWDAQQAFDRKVSAKLAEIPPPASLRATILAGDKIEPLTRRHHLPYWLAMAAAIVVLCVIGGGFHTGQHVSNSRYDEAALAYLGTNGPTLGMISPDHEKVMAWLKQQNAPIGQMPATLATMPTVGCQKYTLRGHSVSLVCFTMAGGQLVHLFMIDQRALTDPPQANTPEFKQMQGWSTASWSDDRMSYLLATQASPDALRQLL